MKAILKATTEQYFYIGFTSAAVKAVKPGPIFINQRKDNIMIKQTITALAALTVAACASNPDKLGTQQVSSYKYINYNCTQLSMQLDNKNARLSSLYTQLKKERDADEIQVGVGLLLFWPTLLFVEGGDGPEAAEYSRLKGEVQAIQEVMINKSCGGGW